MEADSKSIRTKGESAEAAGDGRKTTRRGVFDLHD
jgi:hypothetical protein